MNPETEAEATVSQQPLRNTATPIAARLLGEARGRRALWLACWLLLFLVALDQVRRAWAFRVDDAYITFSFSKNLGSGHGPTFSHGLRVEGYSNFLWMVLIAVRYLFVPDGDPLGFARLLAFGCLGAVVIVVYRLTRRAACPAAALAATALVVSCSDLFRAAASGLETVPFALAIAVGWSMYLQEPAEARRWSLLPFLLAALLRIDGFVPLLAVCGVEVLTALSEHRFKPLKLLRWAAPVVLAWGAYFLWRYEYYGLPLPTTYYAKTAVSLRDPDRGLRQAFDLVRDYGVLAVLPLALLPLLRGPRRATAALSCAVVLQVFYAASVGGDWMPFNRFLLPIVPLAVVVVGWGMQRVWVLFRGLRGLPALLVAAGGVGAVLFSCTHMHAGWVDTPQERDKLSTARFVGDHTRNNLLAVKEMMAYVVRRPGDHLVTDYPGVFSVYTDAEVIDMWGLCNADIALHGGTHDINPIYGKECAECYARLKPDYFHVGVPLLRKQDAFHDIAGVLANVFQGAAIDRVIQVRQHFAVGRVVQEATGKTLWFLERRREELPLRTRSAAPGIRVDYPFEGRPGAR
jgi:hypothetical protein